jgi:hypothetical protein
MFFLHFLAFSFANPPYPISRGLCQANLNGSFYDLTPLRDRALDVYFDRNNNHRYFLRYCKELTQSDIGNQSDTDLFEVTVARCDASDATVCFGVATLPSFDFRFLDPESPNSGIIYRAEGEPFSTRPGQFRETFDVELSIRCDPTQTNVSIDPTFEFDSTGRATELKVFIASAVGCPSAAEVPAPSPTPWEPNCRFVHRNPQNPNYGVDIDFERFNSGGYGARTPLWISGDEFLLYLQLCERAECPIGYSCPEEELSSAWLCAHRSVNKTCVSLGLSDGNPRVSLVNGSDTSKGVIVGLANLSATIKWAAFEPPGHVFWNQSVQAGLPLAISGTSEELREVWIPQPQPGGECTYTDRTLTGEFVSLDIARYNRSGGWIANVTVTGDSVGDAALAYQPCGGLVCPPGAFCDGDEDATIWLCDDGECSGFGLFERPLELRFADPGNAGAGVNAEYEGGVGKFAEVTWKCDPEGSPGVLTLATNATIANRTLLFDVWAIDACPKIAPSITVRETATSTATETISQSPTVTISQPPTAMVSQSPTATTSLSPSATTTMSPLGTISQSPTISSVPVATATPTATPFPSQNWEPTAPGPTTAPTPRPSANPVVLTHNQTHYVLLNLSEVVQPVYSGTNLVIGPADREYATAGVSWHPWNLQSCPGRTCDAASANLWLCPGSFCHAAADARISSSLSPLPDFSTGAVLRYGGADGHGFSLSISCAIDIPRTLRLDTTTVFSWEDSAVSAATSSGAACPRQLEPAERPSPVLTPTPTRAPRVQFIREFAAADGRWVDVNLYALPALSGWVAVARSGAAERAFFEVHFVEPARAPGKSSLDAQPSANGWRCGSDFCGSIAHAETGLSFQAVNQDPANGVEIAYGPGYGGLSTRISIVCNRSLGGKESILGDVGEMGEDLVVRLTVQTGMVCSREGGPLRKIGPGSVFLCAVLSVLALYVGAGVCFRAFQMGVISWPNEGFWEEVGESVRTAVLWLICRRRPEHRLASGGDPASIPLSSARVPV